MNGTYSIGAGGSFSSMASAQDSLLRWGLDGTATWQLLPGFSFAAQSLPITFRPYPICSNSNSSLTIQPAAGASFNFVNTNTTPVILFDSTSNIIWDGRANGTGNAAIVFEGSG